MKHYTQFILFCCLTFIVAFPSIGQTAGDFRSKASGNWGDHTTWEVYSGTAWIDASTGEFPGGTEESDADNVYLEAGYTVTLEADHGCKDLHLNTSEDVIRISTQDFTLDVWGKMRFYEGTAPGAGTPKPVTSDGVPGWISTGENGFIRFRGFNDRIIMAQGEVNANDDNAGWNMDFDFDPYAIGQANEKIRAGNITVSSGELFMNNLNAYFNLGTAPADEIPSGNFLVKAGAIARGGQGIFKNATTPVETVTVEEGGTLTVTRNGYTLAAADLVLDGTLGLQNTVSFPTNGGMTGAEDVNTFNDVSIEGQGTKTLSSDISVNGKLTLRGIATFSLGSFILTYGPTGELEYAGSSAQTTGSAEFPAEGGPNSLTIMNSNGVTLHDSRALEGLLTLAAGSLTLGDHHLTLGPNSPEVAGSFSTSAMVVTNGLGELRKIFSAPGSFTYPVGETTGGADYSLAMINIISGDMLDNTTYIGIRVVDAGHPASYGSDIISRYWNISSNTTASYDGTFQYLASDVEGDESMIGAFFYSDETAQASSVQLTKGNPGQHQLEIAPLTTTAPGSISGATWVIESIENVQTIPGLTVAPNPATNELRFNLETALYRDIQFSILNSNGKVVFKGNISPMGAHSVNLSSYPSGIYFANIIVDNKKSATYKIIKN